MKLKITVHGVAYEVDVEVLDPGEGFPAASPLPPPRPAAAATTARPPARPAPAAAPKSTPPAGAKPSGDHRSVASPVAGTVLEVRCKAGEAIEENKILFVLEAMKMKTSIAAPAAGRVAQVLVAPGDAVQEGQALLNYE